jgi:hypothetical protein
VLNPNSSENDLRDSLSVSIESYPPRRRMIIPVLGSVVSSRYSLPTPRIPGGCATSTCPVLTHLLMDDPKYVLFLTYYHFFCSSLEPVSECNINCVSFIETTVDIVICRADGITMVGNMVLNVIPDSRLIRGSSLPVVCHCHVRKKLILVSF